jgi:hypothetical protein
MTASEYSPGIDAVRPPKTVAFSGLIKSLAESVRAWANSCADSYAAATMYEHLSGLSNAELHRRGLSRDTLARDVLESVDQTVRR